MTSARKLAVFALLGLSMTGCTFRKKAAPVPVQAQAPPISTGQTPTPLPTLEPEPPPSTTASLPNITNEQPITPPPSAKKKRTAVRKPKPTPTKPGEGTVAEQTATTAAQGAPAAQGTSTAPATTTPPPAQTANAGSPDAGSPIGELSTGDVSTGSQTRRETTDLITSTKNGLDGIKRPLSSQEHDTVEEIKTFLDKARQALNVDDVDGAKTLATKAKVLLDELTKQ